MLTYKEELIAFRDEAVYAYETVLGYVTNHILPLAATATAFYLGIAAGLFALCCLYTFISSTLQDGKPTKLGEPPVAPYWMPILRHAPGVAWDFGSYLTWLKNRKAGDKPYTLYLPGMKMYIVLDAKSIAAVHRKQKAVAFEPLGLHIFSSVFQGPKGAVEALKVGAPGFPVDPTMSKEDLEEKNLMHRMHKLYTEYLNKDHLKTMTAKYAEELNNTLLSNATVKRVLRAKDTQAYQRVDLVAFIKHIIFVAASTALYGDNLMEIAHPTFEQDLWKFDQAFMDFTKGYPKFMMFDAYAARARIVKTMAKWNELALKRVANLENDVEWDKVCGSKIVQERLKFFEATLPDPAGEGAAANHLGLFWAVQANSNPATFWAMTHILFTPGLLQPVLEAIESCRFPSVPNTLPSFDVTKLTQIPIINAIHQETLRLNVSSISARMIIEDTEIDGYTYKKGGIIQLPATTLQYDREFWGDDVEKFNYKRFMPVEGETEAEASKRNKEQQAHMKPFGGGVTLCPGRYFAGQEIWATLAVLLTAFEWQTLWMAQPQMNWKSYGMGALKPMNGLNVGIRKRAGW